MYNVKMLTLLVILFSFANVICWGTDPFVELRLENLVEAKVVSIKEKRGIFYNEFKITRVYRGPKSLLNKKFIVITVDPTRFDGEQAVAPLLKRNEIGLFSVKYYEGKLTPVVFSGLLDYLCRKGISKRFKENEELVHSIHEFGNLNEEEKEKYLIEMTKIKNPKVAEWAVRMLAYYQKQNVKEYFVELNFLKKGEISIFAQIAMDSVLCEKENDKSWLESEKREQLYRRWVNLPEASEREASAVISRIDTATQSKTVSTKDFFGLMKEAISNKAFPLPVRRYCLSLIGRMTEETIIERDSFEYFVETIKSNKEDILREAAAGAIKSFCQMNEDRIIILREILEQAENQKIKKHLTQAIKKYERKKKGNNEV